MKLTVSVPGEALSQLSVCCEWALIMSRPDSEYASIEAKILIRPLVLLLRRTRPRSVRCAMESKGVKGWDKVG